MMTRKNRLVRIGITVALLIASAILCRYLGYHTSAFFSRMLNFVRTFIYIGLISAWGVSANRRVVQSQVRIILNSVSLIMVFWLAIREFKYRFVENPTVIRYLWYSYYLPILLIPLLAFLVSLSLGKSEKYRLPKSSLLLFIPTFVLFALVLTNDLHQTVFVFPETSSVWAENDYSYGPVFIAAAVWCILLSVISLVIMLIKSRSSKNILIRWLPLAPIIISVVNTVLYALRIPFASGDIAVLFCLAISGYFEGCIQGGLIQTNTRYYDLFVASKGICAQIVDRDYNVVVSASDAENIDREKMIQAKASPVILENGRLLHTLEVNGGSAVWSEDISRLLALRETLEDRKEELEERNALLQLEYEREKQHKTVEEQNRLYDLLQNRTQSQLDRINSLVGEYKSSLSENEKQKILSYIVVIGSFIKRRKDFALSFDYSSEISESMLTSALGESFRALRLLGIKGEYLVSTDEKASAEQLAHSYDFFEDVTESVMEKAKYLNVRVCPVNGVLRVSVLTDALPDADALLQKYPDMSVSSLDGDGYMLILPLEGGEEND